jgi:glutamine amidotransferase
MKTEDAKREAAEQTNPDGGGGTGSTEQSGSIEQSGSTVRATSASGACSTSQSGSTVRSSSMEQSGSTVRSSSIEQSLSTASSEKTKNTKPEPSSVTQSKNNAMRSNPIEVIDAAGGNIGSLCRALERIGVPFTRVNGETLPTGDKPIILPGVGNFGAVMNRLTQSKLDSRIKSLVKDGVPFLGVCVGLQVLFDGSEESPGVEGLGLLSGKVVKYTEGKIPQIGWNHVDAQIPGWDSGFAYFVNSYFAAPAQPDVVLYQSEYFKPFCAAVQKDNITAFQFHPEKSGAFGMSLLERWLDYAGV